MTPEEFQTLSPLAKKLLHKEIDKFLYFELYSDGILKPKPSMNVDIIGALDFMRHEHKLYKGLVKKLLDIIEANGVNILDYMETP